MLAFLVGYPFSWFVLLLLISVILIYRRVNKVSAFVLIITIGLGLSITPFGSNAWLNSIGYVFSVEDLVCDEGLDPEFGIFLPGGLTSVNKRVHMTNWTETRIKQVEQYLQTNTLSEIVMPGGDIYLDRREGEYVEKYFTGGIFAETKLLMGDGSYSTFSNFKEIKPLIRDSVTYILFTSKWHGYRAIKTAEKQGIDACLYRMSDNEYLRDLKEYPWNFKAALREYIAIGWYALKGRI